MKSPVLVDTSSWIDFFRGKQSAVTDTVQLALQLGLARLCGPVKAELLQGVKTKKEKQQLGVMFGAVENLDTHEADWETAGSNLQALREAGITLPLTDALIAAIADRHKAHVLTLDPHFSHLKVQLA
ncbi:MAG: PIN domain nuclease [Polaromonas sp.]|nr:MAG: PIN domain nuclease [Polaromonas sp.]